MKHKGRQNFKLSVKNHIESWYLDDRRLEQLQSRIAEQNGRGDTGAKTPEEHSAAHDRQTRLSASWIVLVASVVLVCVLVPVAFNLTQQPGDNVATITEQVRSIADEVARNHIKMKPLEVSGDINKARRYFTSLDFAPVVTSRLQQTRLLGGRYCSIQGVTSAQLRYSQPDNKTQSLYQVTYNPKRHGDIPLLTAGEHPVRLTVRGVKVELWVEKGLLMVSVTDSD